MTSAASHDHHAGSPLLRAIRRGVKSKPAALLGGSLLAFLMVGASTVAIGPAMIALVLFSPLLGCLLLLGLTSMVRIGEAAHDWRGPFACDCLERGRCPACAYDLSALRTDADGLVTCPECGAAWSPGSSQAAQPIVIPESRRTSGDCGSD